MKNALLRIGMSGGGGRRGNLALSGGLLFGAGGNPSLIEEAVRFQIGRRKRDGFLSGM